VSKAALAVVVAVLAVVASATSALAKAPDPPATLSGEILTSHSPATITAPNCRGVPVYNYAVAGTAKGPYAGTFHETGQIAPDKMNVWMITASFTITSSTGTVAGTKSGPVSAFDCDTGFTTAERIGYEAKIQPGRAHGHKRAYRDSGVSSLRFNSPLPGEMPFYEEFHSGQTITPPIPPNKPK
jgi:opacity protein-like surface antigen